VWLHPDLLPTPGDLDDPLGFVESSAAAPASEEDFDIALAELLDTAEDGAEDDAGGEEPKSPPAQ
jgi:hypothetical protein